MEQSTQQTHPLLDAPEYLLGWPSWAAWAAPVKKPLDLRRGLRNAAVDQPDSWTSFTHARTYLLKSAKYAPASLPLKAGVGILVAPPLVFVDFDDLQPEPDSPRAGWATTFLQRAADIGAFTEWSGSGTGAHAFIRVTPSFPVLTRNRYTRAGPVAPVGIEMYSHNRFAALTGFPYFLGARPQLNDPKAGDDLLVAFIADLGTTGAPILSPPIPIVVPPPNIKVREVAARVLDSSPRLRQAFDDPQRAYAEWSTHQLQRSADNSPSAWRFSLYAEAARHSPISPQPLYELFNPKTEPQHPNIPAWQEFSGYLKKPHRVYADVQRAHALAAEEARLLALDLGEPPPAAPSKTAAPRHPANEDLAASWAQLGLAMKITKNSAVPVVGSVNFIRVISKHPHFAQWRIERNILDGTTRVNRQPISDTTATRFLEPMRNILDMSSDPPVQGIRDAIEVVADDSPYDPLVEYLRALPPFSPQSDDHLLSLWLEKVGATPDGDLARYSRRILLGLVARALRPGIKFDYVPVFEGPQGVGKSTLVSLLVGPDYYAVLSGTLQSKDALISLRGKWGIELSEMSAFKKSDEETRKSFFSTASDTFRPPYGRASVTIPRRTVIFGTTNDRQYLSDPSGARRYWPVRFEGQLNLDWLRDNRDRLFAEALHYFEAGEAIYDTFQEVQSPERQQALTERMITPAWQVRVIEHLKSLPLPRLPEGDDSGYSGLLTTQYVANLQRTLDLPPAVQHMSDAQLASFLRRAGFHQHVLSYRHEGRSTKTYGWAQPALLNLTDEQVHAFLSFFPDLFPRGSVPHPWIELRASHLPAALRHLSILPSPE
jgi:hypothetical protein